MIHLSQSQLDRAIAICAQTQETVTRTAADLANLRAGLERDIADNQAFLDRHNEARARLTGGR